MVICQFGTCIRVYIYICIYLDRLRLTRFLFCQTQ